MQGHCRNKEAIHAFGFALRGSTSGADPDAEDVILTCQQYLSSHEPCQEPAVFARATDFEKLPPNGPSQLSARLSLSQRQHREFQKTAEAISREPWSMHAGCAFLLQFLEENANNTSEQWVPLPTQWMLQGTRAEVDATRDEPVGRALAENAFSWNHAKPAPVQVARPPQKLRRLQERCCDNRQSETRAPPRPEALAVLRQQLFQSRARLCPTQRLSHRRQSCHRPPVHWMEDHSCQPLLACQIQGQSTAGIPWVPRQPYTAEAALQRPAQTLRHGQRPSRRQKPRPEQRQRARRRPRPPVRQLQPSHLPRPGPRL